jgi:hypothetical protein
VDRSHAIELELNNAALERLRLAYWSQSWLFSHTGLDHEITGFERSFVLAALANRHLRRISADWCGPSLAPGFAWGGREKLGGII